MMINASKLLTHNSAKLQMIVKCAYFLRQRVSYWHLLINASNSLQ